MRMLPRVWAGDVFIPFLTEVAFAAVPFRGIHCSSYSHGQCTLHLFSVGYQVCALLLLDLNLLLQGLLLLLAFL